MCPRFPPPQSCYTCNSSTCCRRTLILLSFLRACARSYASCIRNHVSGVRPTHPPPTAFANFFTSSSPPVSPGSWISECDSRSSKCLRKIHEEAVEATPPPKTSEEDKKPYPLCPSARAINANPVAPHPKPQKKHCDRTKDSQNAPWKPGPERHCLYLYSAEEHRS